MLQGIYTIFYIFSFWALFSRIRVASYHWRGRKSQQSWTLQLEDLQAVPVTWPSGWRLRSCGGFLWRCPSFLRGQQTKKVMLQNGQIYQKMGLGKILSQRLTLNYAFIAINWVQMKTWRACVERADQDCRTDFMFGGSRLALVFLLLFQRYSSTFRIPLLLPIIALTLHYRLPASSQAWSLARAFTFHRSDGPSLASSGTSSTGPRFCRLWTESGRKDLNLPVLTLTKRVSACSRWVIIGFHTELGHNIHPAH